MHNKTITEGIRRARLGVEVLRSRWISEVDWCKCEIEELRKEYFELINEREFAWGSKGTPSDEGSIKIIEQLIHRANGIELLCRLLKRAVEKGGKQQTESWLEKISDLQFAAQRIYLIAGIALSFLKGRVSVRNAPWLQARFENRQKTKIKPLIQTLLLEQNSMTTREHPIFFLLKNSDAFTVQSLVTAGTYCLCDLGMSSVPDLNIENGLALAQELCPNFVENKTYFNESKRTGIWCWLFDLALGAYAEGPTYTNLCTEALERAAAACVVENFATKQNNLYEHVFQLLAGPLCLNASRSCITALEALDASVTFKVQARLSLNQPHDALEITHSYEQQMNIQKDIHQAQVIIFKWLADRNRFAEIGSLALTKSAQVAAAQVLAYFPPERALGILLKHGAYQDAVQLFRAEQFTNARAIAALRLAQATVPKANLILGLRSDFARAYHQEINQHALISSDFEAEFFLTTDQSPDKVLSIQQTDTAMDIDDHSASKSEEHDSEEEHVPQPMSIEEKSLHAPNNAHVIHIDDSDEEDNDQEEYLQQGADHEVEEEEADDLFGDDSEEDDEEEYEEEDEDDELFDNDNEFMEEAEQEVTDNEEKEATEQEVTDNVEEEEEEYEEEDDDDELFDNDNELMEEAEQEVTGNEEKEQEVTDNVEEQEEYEEEDDDGELFDNDNELMEEAEQEVTDNEEKEATEQEVTDNVEEQEEYEEEDDDDDLFDNDNELMEEAEQEVTGKEKKEATEQEVTDNVEEEEEEEEDSAAFREETPSEDDNEYHNDFDDDDHPPSFFPSGNAQSDDDDDDDDDDACQGQGTEGDEYGDALADDEHSAEMARAAMPESEGSDTDDFVSIEHRSSQRQEHDTVALTNKEEEEAPSDTYHTPREEYHRMTGTEDEDDLVCATAPSAQESTTPQQQDGDTDAMIDALEEEIIAAPASSNAEFAGDSAVEDEVMLPAQQYSVHSQEKNHDTDAMIDALEEEIVAAPASSNAEFVGDSAVEDEVMLPAQQYSVHSQEKNHDTDAMIDALEEEIIAAPASSNAEFVGDSAVEDEVMLPAQQYSVHSQEKNHDDDIEIDEDADMNVPAAVIGEFDDQTLKDDDLPNDSRNQQRSVNERSIDETINQEDQAMIDVREASVSDDANLEKEFASESLEHEEDNEIMSSSKHSATVIDVQEDVSKLVVPAPATGEEFSESLSETELVPPVAQDNSIIMDGTQKSAPITEDNEVATESIEQEHVRLADVDQVDQDNCMIEDQEQPVEVPVDTHRLVVSSEQIESADQNDSIINEVQEEIVETASANAQEDVEFTPFADNTMDDNLAPHDPQEDSPVKTDDVEPIAEEPEEEDLVSEKKYAIGAIQEEEIVTQKEEVNEEFEDDEEDHAEKENVDKNAAVGDELEGVDSDIQDEDQVGDLPAAEDTGRMRTRRSTRRSRRDQKTIMTAENTETVTTSPRRSTRRRGPSESSNTSTNSHSSTTSLTDIDPSNILQGRRRRRARRIVDL